MKKAYLIFTLIFFVLLSAFTTKEKLVNKALKTIKISFNQFTQETYYCINDTNLSYEALAIALKGYYVLQANNKLPNNRYLTIIDMSKSANTQRLFTIDMISKEIVHKSLVAHGRNSGEEFATAFSNRVNSYQTSLGFYKTAETYDGKKGLSLKLDGLEYANSNARDRGIIFHAANYVNHNFIVNNGRLGRSLGCPSLPKKGYTNFINKIKEGSCVFIYYPKKYYLAHSKYVNATVNYCFANNNELVSLVGK